MPEVVLTLGCMTAFQRHLLGRAVFVQNGGFRRQRFQRRGSDLGRISY